MVYAETRSLKVIYKRYDTILKYPYAIKKDNSGTSTGKAAYYSTTTITHYL